MKSAFKEFIGELAIFAYPVVILLSLVVVVYGAHHFTSRM